MFWLISSPRSSFVFSNTKGKEWKCLTLSRRTSTMAHDSSHIFNWSQINNLNNLNNFWLLGKSLLSAREPYSIKKKTVWKKKTVNSKQKPNAFVFFCSRAQNVPQLGTQQQQTGEYGRDTGTLSSCHALVVCLEGTSCQNHMTPSCPGA